MIFSSIFSSKPILDLFLLNICFCMESLQSGHVHKADTFFRPQWCLLYRDSTVWPKLLEISSFYTSAPKTKIIWSTVPDIQSESETDRIFCHFWPFFACYTWVPKITTISCMLPEIWNTTNNFLLFWAIFSPFTPLLTPKIKVLKKCKKALEILSYYTCVP